jgi:hypothetical protein
MRQSPGALAFRRARLSNACSCNRPNLESKRQPSRLRRSAVKTTSITDAGAATQRALPVAAPRTLSVTDALRCYIFRYIFSVFLSRDSASKSNTIL